MTYELPGGSICIANQSLTIVNSNFLDLTPDAIASLYLRSANVTFKTATFVGNKQATAGMHYCLHKKTWVDQQRNLKLAQNHIAAMLIYILDISRLLRGEAFRLKLEM